jgi:hypothetical protein
MKKRLRLSFFSFPKQAAGEQCREFKHSSEIIPVADLLTYELVSERDIAREGERYNWEHFVRWKRASPRPTSYYSATYERLTAIRV